MTSNFTKKFTFLLVPPTRECNAICEYFLVYISLTQSNTTFLKLQNHRVVTSVLEQFWCPNLVKIYSILSKVEDFLHNLHLVLGFHSNNAISYSVIEFCKYLSWSDVKVSEILNDVLYLQNKNYFCIRVRWFCWYMEGNAKHFEKLGFQKFTSL